MQLYRDTVAAYLLITRQLTNIDRGCAAEQAALADKHSCGTSQLLPSGHCAAASSVIPRDDRQKRGGIPGPLQNVSSSIHLAGPSGALRAARRDHVGRPRPSLRPCLRRRERAELQSELAASCGGRAPVIYFLHFYYFT